MGYRWNGKIIESSNVEDRKNWNSNFGQFVLSGSSLVSFTTFDKGTLEQKLERVILIIGLVLYFGFGINPLFW